MGNINGNNVKPNLDIGTLARHLWESAKILRSSVEASLVICRPDKDLFINPVNEITREQARSFLTDEPIARIVKAYGAFADVEGLARVLENETISQQQCNLSVRAAESGNGRAAENSAGYGEGNLMQAIGAWQECSVELRK